MPLIAAWKKRGTRVLTPVGAGAIVNPRPRGGSIEIRLDKPWVGTNQTFQSPGEIVLDTGFSLLRILNVDGVGFVTSATNYPTWEEVRDLAMMGWPFTEDETVFGLNFVAREAECARDWNRLGDFHIIEAGVDRHTLTVPKVAETRDKAIEMWERSIRPLGGTSGHLLMVVMLAFEDDETRILARKVLGTTMVLKDERYY